MASNKGIRSPGAAPDDDCSNVRASNVEDVDVNKDNSVQHRRSSTDSLAFILARSETTFDLKDSVTDPELKGAGEYREDVTDSSVVEPSRTTPLSRTSAGRDTENSISGGSGQYRRSRLAKVNQRLARGINRLPSIVSNSFPRINYTRMATVSSEPSHHSSLPNLVDSTKRKLRISKKVTWKELSKSSKSCQDLDLLAGIHGQAVGRGEGDKGKAGELVVIPALVPEKDELPTTSFSPQSVNRRTIEANSADDNFGAAASSTQQNFTGAGDVNNAGDNANNRSSGSSGGTNSTKWKKAKNVMRSIIAAGCGCWQTQRNKPDDWELLQEIREVSSSSSDEIADFRALKVQSTSMLEPPDLSLDLEDADDELIVEACQMQGRRRIIPVGSLAFNSKSTPSYSAFSEETASFDKIFIDGIIELDHAE